MDDKDILTLLGRPLGDSIPDASAMEDVCSVRLDEKARTAARRALEDPDVYASQTGLSERVGLDYLHRAVFELIQNAHDAQDADQSGHVHVKLIVRDGGTSGELHVANRGHGLTWDNVDAIRYPARSTKRFGKGIGNKGLGFRSLQHLTQVPEIYSCTDIGRTRPRFDGYCFRFATDQEALALLRDAGASEEVAREMLPRILRSLLTVPLREQPDEMQAYAQEGYATVVRVILDDAEAVRAAQDQVQELLNPEVPPALFLERIALLSVEMVAEGRKSHPRRIEREGTLIGDIPLLPSATLHRVKAGREKFLVVRRVVPRGPLEDAIRSSLKHDPKLAEWLEAEDETVVSVAVPLRAKVPKQGRIYCHLPLAPNAKAPLHGHVNAPFVVSLSRKELDVSIPLNAFLLDMCAEASIAAAVRLSELGAGVSGASVGTAVDFFCWDPGEIGRLQGVCGGKPYRNFDCLPVAGGERWTSLRACYRWDHGGATLRASRIAEQARADVLDPGIGPERLRRIENLARVAGRHALAPVASVVAGWVEAAAAHLIKSRGAVARWGKFLDEVVEVFGDLKHDMSVLRGRPILIDKEEKLLCAQADETNPVYWPERSERSRRREIPPPPRGLTRRFRAANDSIRVDPTTRAKLLKAELVSEYDPVHILRGIPGTMPKKPGPTTLWSVLHWAFRVWLSLKDDAKDAVREAGLVVPTASGEWRPASAAYFSRGWTNDGQRLEIVCRELADVSKDAAELSAALLPPFEAWNRQPDETLANWTTFLDIAGVTDGLRALPGLEEGASGRAHHFWAQVFRNRDIRGASDAWRAAVRQVSFYYPQSNYRLGIGENLWRLPAQSEHGHLSTEGKQEYAALVLSYLGRTGARHLDCTLAHEYRSDTTRVPTPLRCFLTEASWLPCVDPGGDGIAVPREVWWRKGKGGDVPRVLPRPHQDVRQFLENDAWATLIRELGVNDWSSPKSAAARLAALAHAVGEGLVADDTRGIVRSSCAQALDDLVAAGDALPPDTPIVVGRRGALELLRPSIDEPLRVYVAQGIANSFEARLLNELGAPFVEDVDDAELVATLLRKATFDATTIEHADVMLEADGQRFEPTASDERLAGDGRSWIGDVAVLALDLDGGNLAKVINRTQFRAALGKVRLRFCDTLRVVVDGVEVATSGGMIVPVRDRERPALVIGGRRELDWSTLREIARPLERLVDGRVSGALQIAFMRLSYRLEGTPVARPDPEVLANILECPVERIVEVTSSTQSGNEHVLSLIAPAVACWAGVDAARRLLAAAEDTDGDLDLAAWLVASHLVLPVEVETLLAQSKECDDKDTFRRALGLSLADFNDALKGLGQDPLVNRANLRGQFDYHLGRLRAELVDRLRAIFVGAYRRGEALDAYTELRTLDFVEFDDGWLLSKEALDEDDVRGQAEAALKEFTKSAGDSLPELEPLSAVHTCNTAVIGDSVPRVGDVVFAWCRKSGGQPAPVWSLGRADILRHVERKGLLDFVRLLPGDQPRIYRMAGLWPDGMPETLALAGLGLSETDLGCARTERTNERQRMEAEKRRIALGDTVYDGGDDTEMAAMVAAARKQMDGDPEWQDRCVEAKLAERTRKPSTSGTGSGSVKGRGRPSHERLSEAQRNAIGLLGEFRALRWVARHHKLGEEDAAKCWVSRNRRHAYVDGGDDGLGYDFEVVLPSGRRFQYEVKASQEDPCQFELGSSEVRAATKASPDRRGHVQYRILYVPYVNDPELWRVVELPNPLAPSSRSLFDELGRASLRFGFERKD